MRKTAILALTLAAGLGLSACSEKTQEHAEQTANSIEKDVGAAADNAGIQAQKGADRLGAAASEGANSLGEAADAAGEKLKDGAARVEAEAQGEPKDKAKHD